MCIRFDSLIKLLIFFVLFSILHLLHPHPDRCEDDSILNSLKGLEIYWPYSENWDGSSIPVICYSTPDFKYINEDKVMAYKLSKDINGVTSLDSLIIDEEYAKSHPVWVVKNSEFNISDLDKIFNSEPTSNGIHYIPRNRNLVKTSKRQSVNSSTNSLVNETKIESIQSNTQHDTWISGGSEYVLYWFFPTSGFGISTHQTSQIKLSRSEISKNTVRTINFDANFDWFVGQEHNRLKVIEFDPGQNISFDIKITTTYHEKESAVSTTGEFKTTITLNNVDEKIMDYTIARTAMFTIETLQSDGSNKKTFNGNGVNVVIKIKPIQGA